MVKIQRYPQGTRILVQMGSLPLDPTLVGRSGTVIKLHPSLRDRYTVQLDGETGFREFAEEELTMRSDSAAVERHAM